MGYQLYPEKHIHLLGLERTGQGSYRCKYPELLAAWLKKQGLVEVEAYGHGGHTELMLEGTVPPQPPESTLTPEEWELRMGSRGYVHIYNSGTVRVGGAVEKLEEMLQELIRE
jgi:hypothetical protein